MMYSNGFALSILGADGRPVREIEGRAALPFGSEYKIKLRNRDKARRALAHITIDGTPLCSVGDGNIILKAGEVVNIERFVTESLTEGRKLKFVQASNPGVQDPHSSENGIIRVEFKKEKELPNWLMSPPSTDYGWHNQGRWTKSTKDRLGTYGSTTVRGHDVYCNTSMDGDFGVVYGETKIGATVAGGFSDQKFTMQSGFDTELGSTVLEIKMIGAPGVVATQAPKFCSECGKKRKHRDNFCSGCGYDYMKVRPRV